MNGLTGPTICVVIARTRHKMIQAEIQAAARLGARLIEVRLDFIAKQPDFQRLLANKPCPLIATVRRGDDGGRFAGTEAERLVLLRQAIVAGFDWVDLETDVIDGIKRFGKTKRIVSYHNLREVPADLDKIYQRMCQQDADIVKLSVTAHQTAHNLRLLQFLKNPPKPTIAICTGDLGVCSRVLSAKLGSPFTYAAFNRERTVESGMPLFHDLQNVYRYEQLNANTEVLGVIGDPVGHNLSPLIHNAALAHHGINAVYLPFRVPRGDLATFLKTFEQIPVAGYSVTVPHKEEAAALASWQDDMVQLIGAANTLVRSPTGWRAYNTDAQAAFEAIEANLPIQPDGSILALASSSVLILGAGGIARAIAFMLQRMGCNVSICNRTPERGHDLAQAVGCRVVEWEARHNVLCDILVNCTSVGMHPHVDDMPVHASFLTSNLTVFDVICNPETTMLIREAMARGCNVLTGVGLFIRQAGLQFKLFTGLEPPLELMIDLARKALSPVRLGADDARL